MKRLTSYSARLATLIGLAALLALSSTGCQCCAVTERYQDCVDNVCDHEGHAQVLYRPWYDLTRINRANWPWRWFRHRRPSPGFVYRTPVTNEVMSRTQWQQDQYAPPSTIAPPPLMPDELWPSPESGMNADDVGVAPLGPLFEPQVVPPPAPEPFIPESLPPAPTRSIEPQLPPMESSDSRRREPTPAAPRLPVSSEIDAGSHRPGDWMRNSGVVRLFDEDNTATSASGITIHQYDRTEFVPITVESWLSDETPGSDTVETASGREPDGPTTASTPADTSPPWAASQHVSENAVRAPEVHPTSGTQSSEDSHQEQRAQWWEAQPTTAPATRTANDVFGPTPFAEWQSANE